MANYAMIRYGNSAHMMRVATLHLNCG